MKNLYFIFLLLLLAACQGSPDPETLGPTTEKPVFFLSPKNNRVLSSGEAVSVRLELAPNFNFSKVGLLVNGRDVRLEQESDSIWASRDIDDALLTFLPGQHSLTAYAETEAGEVFRRTITIYAETERENPVGLPEGGYVTHVEATHIETGYTYPVFYPGDFNQPLGIPIEDFGGEGVEFEVFTEGDIFQVYFWEGGLQEPVLRFGEEGFKVTVDSGGHEYSRGTYYLNVQPSYLFGGDTLFLPVVNVPFRVLDSKLKVKTRNLEFAERLGAADTTHSTIEIDNLGNRSGQYRLEYVPDWLVLDATEGSVEPGESALVSVSAQPCDKVESQVAVVKVISDEFAGTVSDIHVSRECVEGPLFDLSLDRFYFSQSVPANDSLVATESERVELVKGRAGIARSFVLATHDSEFRLPEVRLVYRTASGSQSHYELTGPAAVPESIYEGSLEQTFNGKLPEEFFELGTEYYVLVDPNNEIDERREDNNRYPTSGYLKLNIRDTPPLKLTLIPMVRSGESNPPVIPESSIESLTQRVRALMPLADIDVTIREQPFSYTRNSWAGVVSELDVLYEMEQGEGHYYGVLAEGINEDYVGWAKTGGQVAVGRAHPDTIAHELGHNFGLRHANCGSPPGVDPNYPHEGGQTDTWGYNIFSGLLKQPSLPDFMSYCAPDWISSYHYSKILDYRGGELFPKNVTAEKADLFTAEPSGMKEEVLVISGVMERAKAKIDYTHYTFGSVTPRPNTSPYEVILLDEYGSEIYRGKLQSTSLSHSHQQIFSVEIPTRQINANIARVVIKSNQAVYLDERWQHADADILAYLYAQTKVSRIDERRVRVKWPADGEASLRVRDPLSGNMLAVDKTGEVVVFSSSSSLELKYAHRGHESIEVVSVD